MYYSFEDMPVWKDAFAIAKNIYQITDNFPSSEIIGLTSQMRRAAVSTFSNISEGYGRDGRREKRRFYIVSRASMFELKGQILFANEVGFLSEEIKENQLGLIARWFHDINKLIKSLS